MGERKERYDTLQQGGPDHLILGTIHILSGLYI